MWKESKTFRKRTTKFVIAFFLNLFDVANVLELRHVLRSNILTCTARMSVDGKRTWCNQCAVCLLFNHTDEVIISHKFRIRAHLHPATATRLWCCCDIALNGLQSHFQSTDKFDASIETDAYCNSIGQNPYILIWERSRSGVTNAGCKQALKRRISSLPANFQKCAECSKSNVTRVFVTVSCQAVFCFGAFQCI